MAAEVLSLADARIDRAGREQLRRLPLAVHGHSGAVEAVVLARRAEDEVELWLTPEQAIEIGEDLSRAGRQARGGERG